MITQTQLEQWLVANKLMNSGDGVFTDLHTKYELFADHYRKYLADKSGQWHLLEVTTYVDLFRESDGSILDKWHHVIGKSLSTIPQILG